MCLTQSSKYHWGFVKQCRDYWLVPRWEMSALTTALAPNVTAMTALHTSQIYLSNWQNKQSLTGKPYIFKGTNCFRVLQRKSKIMKLKRRRYHLNIHWNDPLFGHFSVNGAARGMFILWNINYCMLIIIL